MNALSPFYYGQKEIRTVKIGDEIWFAGKDICEGLDIAWTSRTLDPIKSDWKRVMNLITPRGNQDLTVISEAAVYKLAFRSRKPEAEKFTDWIAGEVLPQIRKTGKYIPPNHGILPLVLHTDVTVQKAMSKYVNSHNFRKIGKKGAINYNIKNCQAHNNGLTPKQMKELGKSKGLRSVDRQSGKAVARKLFPEKACCQSLADNLVEQGYEAQKVFNVTPKAMAVFQGILQLGAIPPELNQIESK